MLLTAHPILHAVQREIAQLQAAAGSSAEGSALQALGLAVSLIAAREQAGAAGLHAQLQGLEQPLSEMAAHVAGHAALAAQLAQIRERIAQAHAEPVVDRLESIWRQVVGDLQAFASDVAGSEAIEPAKRDRITALFVDWECGDLRSQLGAGGGSPGATSTEITHERWRDYLRDRFDEPTLDVTAFKSLAGGFGKQTTLFDVKGKAITGAYVLRRDLDLTLFDNDCHRIEKEFALIRAVHGLGFPAPEAVWLDTTHRLLPGGHFLVMRRAPGVSGGSVFQAQGAVPADLAQTLAAIMARLHTLPPMLELGALTDSIAPALWELPIGEVVRRYLVNWHDLFEREAHLPSPAMVSQFGWLLDHIPPAEGRPVLLHGDIGFHNFLFDGGRLTAVLDWEFGHIGDPAEDLAYVRNTLGASLDWKAFLAAYQAAGGPPVSEERLHFFQVWGHLRNACASNMATAKFDTRQIGDLKLVLLPHLYIPQFLQAAQALIQQGT
jgi:aminoglycoside phosphotransferase (APT) family kinase protein